MPHDSPAASMLLARTEPSLQSIHFFALTTQDTLQQINEADLPSVGVCPDLHYLYAEPAERYLITQIMRQMT